MIYREWQNYLFDSLELVNYTVLLSYPNTSNPNILHLRNNQEEVIYESHIAMEQPLTPGENDSTVAPPFNAYSGSGKVTVSSVQLALSQTIKVPVYRSSVKQGSTNRKILVCR